MLVSFWQQQTSIMFFLSFGAFTVATQLNFIGPLNSFMTTKIVGHSWLSLPCPLLSPAVGNFVGYALRMLSLILNSYHWCLSIETVTESRPAIISIQARPPERNSPSVINYACVPQAEQGSPRTLVYC